MNYRLLAQSLVFMSATLISTALLGVAVRFGIARLLLAIGVAGICLIAEIYVAVKVTLGVWKWSGGLVGTIVSQIAVRRDRKVAPTADRGEA